MKENINFDNSNPTITDNTDLLRKDTKNLIYSLKKHQTAVKESFSKLKDENNQYNLLLDNHHSPNEYPINSPSTSKIAYFLDTVLSEETEIINDELDDDDHLITESYYNKNRLSASVTTKTVSFNEFLLGKSSTSGMAGNRRSRSISPSLNKTPTKSILKKQLVHDELSDNEEDEVEDELDSSNDPDSSSNSTNSLLCSDIYGDFEKNLDFENDSDPCGMTMLPQFTGSCLAPKNTNKLIDLISRKRQACLNHIYQTEAEQPQAVAVTKTAKPCSVKMKQSKIPIKKNSRNAWKTPNALASATNRSKSADHDKQKILSDSHRNNPQPARLNKFSAKNSNPTATATTSSEASFRPKMKLKLASSLNPKPVRDYKKLASHIKKMKPLLGYDWAVDDTDNRNSARTPKPNKSEDYWQELSKFRSQNKEECVSQKHANFDGSSTSFFDTTMNADLSGVDAGQTERISGDDDGRSHKCIHSYTLNERLFPVPVYKGKNGQSACPVCKSGRKEATSFAPQFCKVSIPKSRIMEPYKLQFGKEVSEDSVSLAGVSGFFF